MIILSLVPFLALVIWLPLAVCLFVIGVLLACSWGPIFCAQTLATEAKNKHARDCIWATVISLFPLFSFSLMVVFIGLVVIYPCTRRTYHHGLYDYWDSLISGVSLCFFYTISALMGCK